MTDAELVKLARARLEAAGAGGPRQVFAAAVKMGLIDREGRVTKRYGGTAEVDESARPEDEREE